MNAAKKQTSTSTGKQQQTQKPSAESQQAKSVKQSSSSKRLIGETNSSVHRIAQNVASRNVKSVGINNSSPSRISSNVNNPNPRGHSGQGGKGKLVLDTSHRGGSTDNNGGGANDRGRVACTFIKIGPHLVNKCDKRTFEARRKALFKLGMSKSHLSNYAQHFGSSVPLTFGAGSVPFSISSSSEGGKEKVDFMGFSYMEEVRVGSAIPLVSYDMGQLIYCFPITPKSFPAAAAVLESELYSEAKLKGLELVAMPTCSATTPGSLIAFYVPNNSWYPTQKGSGPNSIAMAYESMNFIEWPVYSTASHAFPIPNEFRDIYTDITAADAGSTCCGFIVVMAGSDLAPTTPGGANSLCHLGIKYHWEFTNRQYLINDIQTSSRGNILVDIPLPGIAVDRGDHVIFGQPNVTTTEFTFPPAGPVGAVTLLFVAEVNDVTTGFSYLMQEQEDGLAFLLTPGDLFFVIATLDVSVGTDEYIYAFFSTWDAALTVLQTARDTDVVEKGDIRFAVTDANLVVKFAMRALAILL
jgi:hypothetical protein